jgi:hypothetical protein
MAVGQTLATLLLFALTIGLAVPLLPFAARLARGSVHTAKDAVLVALIACVLLYATFAPASLLGMVVAYPIAMIAGALLGVGGVNIGQGGIAFLFVWVGLWAVAVFCAACFATVQLNDWWNRRSS